MFEKRKKERMDCNYRFWFTIYPINCQKVREAKVYSEILPYYINLEKIQQDLPKGIILSGGPASVYEGQAPVCDKKIFELGIPILGICYGAQLIAQVSGGKVIKHLKQNMAGLRLFWIIEKIFFMDFLIMPSVG